MRKGTWPVMSTTIESAAVSRKSVQSIPSATVRFAGDSGDGMQITGDQLTRTAALMGSDVATFPDYPAEIRAPRGTLAGVSGFQVHFASEDIFTPGDQLDALVVMNPAALKTNLGDLRKGGILIVNTDNFQKSDLELAKYETNPLDSEVLEHTYQLFKVQMSKITRDALKDMGMGTKEMDRCKNFFALGLVYWLYGRELEPTIRFLDEKFGGKPEIAESNRRALKAGWNYGETTDAFASSYKVEAAKLPPGTYKNVMGNQAMAWGLMAAAHLSGKELFLGSYPITPATDILHELSKYKNYGVKTFQAEDEIAAMGSAIGASYGGSMGITTSSGPGIALKTEGIGLAIMLELPVLVINIQRGGPSTGLPTKTEQADLFQAVLGRNGEAPLPVIAARSPSDCFNVAQEAWRIATRFMTPVMILSDGYIANGSEPWLIPDVNTLPKIPVTHAPPSDGTTKFLPYKRDELLARPWAIPGTKGLMHRIGGLEKQDTTGNVNYEPENHQHMVNTRAKKVENVALEIPQLEVEGPDKGDLLVLSWGGTYGACRTAVEACLEEGLKVAHAHLTWMNPFPSNLEQVLRSYKKVLIPELNLGQLRTIVRAKFLIDAQGFNKVQGRPFTVAELTTAIRSHLGVADAKVAPGTAATAALVGAGGDDAG
ncbi:pyruvate flavodoxin/ferredoxin oxidoreductase domain protein [Pirellula staleyi DSM 6068]|uniref:Pyruvate flavodoxin/ferredoxin oxidoreductase domain protein n=1 Tax=Pirellula staleyi (strain ATCC 27377 / DSM 6068 / ICPB 4128) TaxID=530564 RepID=D2R6B2_PIRSD|nr:pyruvate flavodoxin/ferredoxin oxidoreductase domain protein [Pirellula staleyi DSM 6068]